MDSLKRLNKWLEPVYLLMAELSSSRRREASVVEVLSSLDRLSILFRITSSMSLIFRSTPRDSTPPITEWRKRRRGDRAMKNERPACGAGYRLACALIPVPAALSTSTPSS